MADITRFQIIVAILLCVYKVSAKSDCTIGDRVERGTNNYRDGIVVVLSYKVIPCNGDIAEWEYWAGKPGLFRAIIVRPNTDDSTRFHIIGINDITVTSETASQKSIYSVPKDNRIPVKSGDMIAVGILSGTDNPQLQITTDLNQIRYVILDPTTLTLGRMLLTDSTDNYNTSITATIHDAGPPVIVNTPSSQHINTDPYSATAAVWWTLPKTNNLSSDQVTLKSDYSPGDNFTIGITTVTYTAVDVYNNMATYAFDVIVIDAEPPVIVNTSSSQHVNTDPYSATAAVWWTPPTASDNSDEVVTLTSDYSPGDNFTIGNTTVTYIAVDLYRNMATYAFDVIVTDAEPPVIVNTSSSQHVNTDPNSVTAAVWWTPPTAKDNSGEPVTLISNYYSGDNFTIGNTTVTYTAVDVSGNTATYSFHVVVTVRKDQNAALLMIVGYLAALLIPLIIILIIGVLFYKLWKSKSVREETGHEIRDSRPTETTMSTEQNEYMTSRPNPLAEFKDLKTGLPESCYYDDVPTEQSVYQNIAMSDHVKGQNEETIYDLPETEHRNSPSTLLRNRDEGETYQNVCM